MTGAADTVPGRSMLIVSPIEVPPDLGEQVESLSATLLADVRWCRFERPAELRRKAEQMQVAREPETVLLDGQRALRTDADLAGRGAGVEGHVRTRRGRMYQMAPTSSATRRAS